MPHDRPGTLVFK